MGARMSRGGPPVDLTQFYKEPPKSKSKTLEPKSEPETEQQKKEREEKKLQEDKQRIIDIDEQLQLSEIDKLKLESIKIHQKREQLLREKQEQLNMEARVAAYHKELLLEKSRNQLELQKLDQDKKVEEKSKRDADEKSKRDTEERLKRETDEKAKREAEEKKREVEAKRIADEKRLADEKKLAEEKQKRDADEKKKLEDEKKLLEEKQKRDADEKKKKDSDEKLKMESEKLKQEQEAKQKSDAEVKQKQEAEAKQKSDAEAKQKQEVESKQKLDAEAKQKQEAEAKQKQDAEKKKRDEEEKLRLESETKKNEEKQKQDAEKKKRDEEEKLRLESESKKNEEKQKQDAEKKKFEEEKLRLEAEKKKTDEKEVKKKLGDAKFDPRSETVIMYDEDSGTKPPRILEGETTVIVEKQIKKDPTPIEKKDVKPIQEEKKIDKNVEEQQKLEAIQKQKREEEQKQKEDAKKQTDTKQEDAEKLKRDAEVKQKQELEKQKQEAEAAKETEQKKKQELDAKTKSDTETKQKQEVEVKQKQEAEKKKKEQRQVEEEQALKVDQQLEEVRKKTRTTDAVWQDPDFVPGDAAIGYPTKGTDQPNLIKEVAKWLRPHEIRGAKNPVLFKDGANKNDVNQGAIGDCYLICTFSIVTEHPELMSKLFVSTEEDHKVGRYTVRIYLQGGWRYITIDDRIPCNSYGTPVFARCADPDEIWVMLLEKAFAKVGGSYISLWAGNKGSEGSALEKITGGFGLRTFEHKNTEECWKKLHSMFANDTDTSSSHVATLSGKFQESQATKNLGLVGNHAYSVIRTVELSGGHKLVQCRNPWGMHEWSGRWGDKSKEWTPDLLREVNQIIGKESELHKTADDGTFFMCFEDFCKYWNTLWPVRIIDKEKCWSKKQVHGKWSNDEVRYVIFDVSQETEVAITLNQSQHLYTFIDNAEPGQVSCRVHPIVNCKLEQEFASDYSNSMHLLVNDRVYKPGKYAVVIKSAKAPHRAFAVTLYSKKEIQTSQVLGEEDYFVAIGYNCFEQRARSANKEKRFLALNVLQTCQISISIKCDMPKDAYGYISCNNLDNKQYDKSGSCGYELPKLDETLEKGFYQVKLDMFINNKPPPQVQYDATVRGTNRFELSEFMSEEEIQDEHYKYLGHVVKTVQTGTFGSAEKIEFKVNVPTATSIYLSLNRNKAANPAYFSIYDVSEKEIKTSPYTWGEVITMEKTDLKPGNYKLFVFEAKDKGAPSGAFKMLCYSQQALTISK